MSWCVFRCPRRISRSILVSVSRSSMLCFGRFFGAHFLAIAGSLRWPEIRLFGG